MEQIFCIKIGSPPPKISGFFDFPVRTLTTRTPTPVPLLLSQQAHWGIGPQTTFRHFCFVMPPSIRTTSSLLLQDFQHHTNTRPFQRFGRGNTGACVILRGGFEVRHFLEPPLLVFVLKQKPRDRPVVSPIYLAPPSGIPVAPAVRSKSSLSKAATAAKTGASL